MWKKLEKIEEVIIVIPFIVMIISAFLQVVNRNIIKASIGWYEELARYCMIYMVIFATEIGLRDGTQIAVEAVYAKAKGIAKTILTIIIKTVVIVFSGVAGFYSVQLVLNQVVSRQTSPGLRVPMYIPTLGMTCGLLLIAVVQLIRLISYIRDLKQLEEVKPL
ncbi:MAG: transporter small permease [Clostridia bacterium]|jgi:TRAP-type C4-dicarboxylate transport system permease small subunit|nr:transporter small permease [Clostridia bacterium]